MVEVAITRILHSFAIWEKMLNTEDTQPHSCVYLWLQKSPLFLAYQALAEINGNLQVKKVFVTWFAASTT